MFYQANDELLKEGWEIDKKVADKLAIYDSNKKKRLLSNLWYF